MIPIYIGYDPKEALAYHVCTNSIIRHATSPVSFIPLSLNTLCNYTETHNDGSNQFIYTRFLVPSLQNYKGWAIYIDSDIILKADIAELWNLRDNSKAVMCVHHDYKTTSSFKYFGNKNEDYPRKNWSSVILWNCDHKLNQNLSPRIVQQHPGSYLHRFSWIPDTFIREIPNTWNWLPDEFGTSENAKLIHYTLGVPDIYTNVAMASDWQQEKNHALKIG